MSTPTVGDGQPILGDVVVVIDESSPGNGLGGIAYVVTAAALISPGEAAAALSGIFGPHRVRPFHWTKAGIEVRSKIIDLIVDRGIVAMVHCSHVGRRGQMRARTGMIADLSGWAAAEGATHLIIESGDAATNGRDRAALLDHHREAGGVPFAYDWRSKAEPLLWIADAIAGAVGEHVSGKDDHWFARLDAAGVITLMFR